MKKEISVTNKRGCVFTLTDRQPYQRKRDGSWTELLIWTSNCIVCGKPFAIKTPSNYENNGAFALIHCDEHKLTQDEINNRRRQGVAAAKAAGKYKKAGRVYA